ncbi:MAG: class 1 fructose-bisphosphatase [Trueperaceae bacterium]|nr:class 1 fructose-bisphosphatase [Trueperaceae bacterium]
MSTTPTDGSKISRVTEQKKQKKYMTLNRFLVERQQLYPGASGQFTNFMGQIGTAAKIISNHMRRAALEGLLGRTGTKNVQGEEVKKLDEIGNEIFVEAFEYVDIVGMLVSEEMSEAQLLTPEGETGGYVVMVDPIDGSSNIDVNGIIGSIFSVHDIAGDVEGSLKQKGSEQIAAGYMMYGSSTILVYTAGNGVHKFVLDDNIGEFILDEQDLTIPERGDTFSANVGYYHRWTEPVRAFTDHVMRPENGPYSLRYSGALLADLHRILHHGGIYYYPEDDERPDGKLRLLYECAPLAMIAEEAGGAASTGTQRVMDIEPNEIHQRSPLAIGSRKEVELYEQFHQKK